MVQKQMEERLETNEKDIEELKDIVLGLSKSKERLEEELRETSVSLQHEECGTSEGFAKGTRAQLRKEKWKKNRVRLRKGLGSKCLNGLPIAKVRRLRKKRRRGHRRRCRNGLQIARGKELKEKCGQREKPKSHKKQRGKLKMND